MRCRVLAGAGSGGRPSPGRSGAPLACAVAGVLAVAALVGGGCGIAGGSASLGPTTTQAAVLVRLAVDPIEGPIGTVFTLTSEGMTPGAAVQFEITFPGEGRAYPGNALVVADDGTASATYRATSANQPGPYVVRLTGPQGQLAIGEFRVTDGKPLTSTTARSTSPTSSGKSPTTAKGGSTTSAKTGTTARPGTTSASTTTTLPMRPIPTVPPTGKPSPTTTSQPPTP